MFKVICINDEKLPIGAKVTKGEEYEVIETFINYSDQIVYIIEGVPNQGRTQYGLPWMGYNSSRFSKLDVVSASEVEYQYADN